jgi:ribosomal protein S18 acetylase RimI-like enzyme
MTGPDPRVTGPDPHSTRTGPPPGRITVRPARTADHPRIAELTVAAYRASGQSEPGHPYEAVLVDVAGRASAGELLVAEDATGRVVGSVLLVRAGSRYAELCGPTEAEFRMLAVDPAAQGSGAGAALVRACLDRATELGATAMVICTRDNALAAQRLYQRFGFVRVPELDWHPLPGITLLALRLPLPAGESPVDNERATRSVRGG